MRRRRLQPKAAAAPSRGRGPGTDAAAGGPVKTLMDSVVPTMVQMPTRPVDVTPRLARLLPLKVALLKKGWPRTYYESSRTAEPEDEDILNVNPLTESAGARKPVIPNFSGPSIA